MSALLAADTTAILSHILIDVLVAHSGLSITDALFIKSLVQTKVGHDSRDHGVVRQLAVFLHVAAVDVQDVIAGDDIALLIHAQAAVSITIESKTDIQTVFHHKLLQAFDVGRASVVVDVRTVRLVVDNIGICAQSIEHRFSNIPACAVGAVQTDLDALFLRTCSSILNILWKIAFIVHCSASAPCQYFAYLYRALFNDFVYKHRRS